MSKIDTENAKTVRQALDVHCGLSYRDTSAPITSINTTFSSATSVMDTNLLESLTNISWELCTLTDLSYNHPVYYTDGFLLDPNNVPELVVPNHVASLANGKYGFRTGIGAGHQATLEITSSGALQVLTMHVAHGSGYIKVTGTNTPLTMYSLQDEYIYIKCHGETSINIQIYSNNDDERVVVDYIVSGLEFELTKDNLISCILDLRSDLSMDNPTWQVSGIEVNAYFPQDMTELVSCITDNTPIWYYAGYDDAEVYSPTRYFYVSDKITLKDNVMTIKGEDISSKLADFNIVPTVRNTYSGNALKTIYEQLVNYIENQVGITLVNKETAPSGSASGRQYATVTKNCSVREWVADLMNLARPHNIHEGTAMANFYPRFVDAGIPSIEWSKPTSKWDIYEEDVTDLKIESERTIARLITEDEYGVIQDVSLLLGLLVLQDNNVTAGQNYSFSDGDYYYYYEVTNGTLSDKPTKNNASTVEWKAINTGTSELCGRKAQVTTSYATVTPTPQRAGISVTVKPIVYGSYDIFEDDAAYWAYPNWFNLFERSPITGSFTFRGDVRMQPRDVFTFHRMNGSTEVCTIENIKLKHENGGTEAEITYRKGVI